MDTIMRKQNEETNIITVDGGNYSAANVVHE